MHRVCETTYRKSTRNPNRRKELTTREFSAFALLQRNANSLILTAILIARRCSRRMRGRAATLELLKRVDISFTHNRAECSETLVVGGFEKFTS